MSQPVEGEKHNKVSHIQVAANEVTTSVFICQWMLTTAYKEPITQQR